MRTSSSKLASDASSRSARTRGARPALFTSASIAPSRATTLLDEADPIGGACHVRLNVTSGPPVPPQLREHVLHRVFRAEAAERQRPSLARQRAAHAKPDAARAAGHEGDGMRRNAVRHDDQCQQERELAA